MINATHIFKEKSDWLQFRGKSIGGSDIATVLGINPYQSKYELWLKLTDRIPPIEENNHMIAGRFLEDAVANWFQYETGHHVVKASAKNIIMEHPEYPFLKASPDRKVFLNGSRRLEDTAIMEIKTTGLKIDPDEVPMHFYLQGLYYAGFWEFPKVIVCWYSRFTNTIDYKEYDFDNDLFYMLISEAVSFWNTYVIPDIPPPAQTEADIKKLFPESVEDKSLIATDEIMDLYSKMITLSRDLRVQKKEYNALATQIKLILRDAEILYTPQLEKLFTFRSGTKSRTLRIYEI